MGRVEELMELARRMAWRGCDEDAEELRTALAACVVEWRPIAEYATGDIADVWFRNARGIGFRMKEVYRDDEGVWRDDDRDRCEIPDGFLPTHFRTIDPPTEGQTQ